MRNGPEARPVLVFSWGFVARHGEITLVAPAVLGDSNWDEHLDTLRRQLPVWHFSAGLADLS